MDAVHPKARLRRICVYCGSALGNNPNFAAAADVLGRECAARDVTLVYGGGAHGLMGLVAKATLAAGGHVIGVIPDALTRYAAMPHENFELVAVPDMHARKRRMFDEADAIVALPGGIGTLEEVCEQLAWIGLGHHSKPVVLLDTNGFWQPFTTLLDHMREQGFIYLRPTSGFTLVREAESVIPTILDLLASR